jgi:hypothetical protein
VGGWCDSLRMVVWCGEELGSGRGEGEYIREFQTLFLLKKVLGGGGVGEAFCICACWMLRLYKMF